jgi:hypothetical protein
MRRLKEKLFILACAMLPLSLTAPDAFVYLKLKEVPAVLRQLEIEQMWLSHGSSSIGRDKSTVAWPIFCYRWKSSQLQCASNLYISHNISRVYMPFDRDIAEIKRRSLEGKLTAWVDPADPSFAVLVRRFDPFALLLHLFLLFLLGSMMFRRRSIFTWQKGKLSRGIEIETPYDKWRDRQTSGFFKITFQAEKPSVTATDPIRDAELYLSYGRTAQAIDILNSAIRHTPSRTAEFQMKIDEIKMSGLGH